MVTPIREEWNSPMNAFHAPRRPADPRHPTTPRAVRLAIALILAVTACSEVPTTAPAYTPQHSATKGKGGPKTADPVIDAVEPASGAPGQSLTVRVLGANFADDATVEWQRDGVRGEIVTDAVRFVSTGELEADIRIAEDATIDFYDVVVASKTRNGIGTEKFEVTTELISECGGRTPLLDSRARLDWGSTLAIRNDGAGAYTGNEGSVHAKVFYHDLTCATGGDVLFIADRNNVEPRRTLLFAFPAGAPKPGIVAASPHVSFTALMQLGSFVSEQGGVDANIYDKIGNLPRAQQHPALSALRPGYPSTPTGPSGMFRFTGIGQSWCGSLEYDRIRMTRTSTTSAFMTGLDRGGIPAGRWSELLPGSWTVESVATEAGGSTGHWARCITTQGRRESAGAWLDMPFRVEITELR